MIRTDVKTSALVALILTAAALLLPVAADASTPSQVRSAVSKIGGRGGAMLKRVGSEARQAIETLLGAHVFLEIRVEVRREWRDDARALKDLGLS